MSKFSWWFWRRWAAGASAPFPPSLSSLAPNTCLHGAASQALTVHGAQFQPGAKVVFGTSTYPATFVDSTQLTVTIAAADLATAGTKSVSVTNPDGHKTATGLNFTIT